MTPKPRATGVREGTRVCPNCGTKEVRWTVEGRPHVNLSPITGQCVDCLVAMTKELGPMVHEPRKRVVVL